MHVVTLGIETGFCYVDAYIALLNCSVVFHLHHMVIIQQQLAQCYPLVSLQEPQYIRPMPEGWLHHNICVPCPVRWHLMYPLNVEINCNDVSFNFQYVMVVIGEKQWQSTPKNLPRMWCARAVPVT